MNLIAGMLARNEAHVIGMTARAALKWCDALVVFDHASSDKTVSVVEDAAHEQGNLGRVVVYCECDPVWHEMRYRQKMLDIARNLGATHFATVDADEILSASLLPHVRSKIEQLPAGDIWEPPWVCMRAVDGAHDDVEASWAYYNTGRWFDNWVDVAFKDHPDYHWATHSGGFDHHHRPPMGARRPSPYRWPHQSQRADAHGGGLMHLQFVDMDRLRVKQFWYQLIEKSRWGHVRSDYVGTVADAVAGALTPAPTSWWDGYEDLLQYYDPSPAFDWHRDEALRMMRENPNLAHGLNDFGTGLIQQAATVST